MDITATLVAAANADSSDLDGRDLLANKTAGTTSIDQSDEQQDDGHLVVEHYGHSGDIAFQRIVYQGDWKYVAAWGDNDEFYNLEDDPYELNCRLHDDTVSDVLRELQQLAPDDLYQERVLRQAKFPQTEMEYKLVVSDGRWPREERLLQYKLEQLLKRSAGK